jgi:hypothetical protein
MTTLAVLFFMGCFFTLGMAVGLWLGGHLSDAPLVDVEELAAQRGAEWADGKR